MKVIEREPHAAVNFKNARYEIKDNGEFIFKHSADVAHFIDTIDECFDSQGNSIGSITIYRKLVVKENVETEIDSDTWIVQINYDFYLLPLAQVWTAPEVEKLFYILENSKFNAEFDLSLDRDRFKANKQQEICVWGNKRLIYNNNPKKISNVEYKENYNKAIKKYPDYKTQIESLYKANVSYL